MFFADRSYMFIWKEILLYFLCNLFSLTAFAVMAYITFQPTNELKFLGENSGLFGLANIKYRFGCQEMLSPANLAPISYIIQDGKKLFCIFR